MRAVKDNVKSYSQEDCYILIIPGFGIVSHVVSAYSKKKPVFGEISMIYACGVPLITRYLCGRVNHWMIAKQDRYNLKEVEELVLKPLIVSLYMLKIKSVDPLNSYKVSNME